MSEPGDLGTILTTDIRALTIMNALLYAEDLDEVYLRRITGLGEHALRQRLDQLVAEGLVHTFPLRLRLLGWTLARTTRFRLTERGRMVFASLITQHPRLRESYGRVFPSAKRPSGEDDDPREDVHGGPR